MSHASVPGPRIALIHALAQSQAPIEAAFARQWPQAQRCNLLDDSLALDLPRGGLDAAMHARFELLAAYAERCGAQALLFTCSAFGPCIEAVAQRRPHLPVFKPYQAMVAAAQAHGGCIGLLASYAPTLASLPAEFAPSAQLRTACVPQALQALQQGDEAAHDACVLAAALELQAQGCALVVLAQYSLARAAPLLQSRLRIPVLTTPDSSVQALRLRLTG